MEKGFRLQFKGRLILSLAFLGIFAMSAYAKVPATVDEIPIYPGAERIDNSPNRYRVDASPEDVFKFYSKELSGVKSEIRFLDESDSMDFFQLINGYEAYKKELKAFLATVRQPYQPGKWISSANFEWTSKGAEGETIFRMKISGKGTLGKVVNWLEKEEGYSSDHAGDPVPIKTEKGRKVSLSEWKNYVKENYKMLGAGIIIETETHKSQEAIERERAEKEKKAEEEVRQKLEEKIAKLVSNPPTENDLGVPVYPGARLDPERTAGTWREGLPIRIYVYLTDDKIENVAAFYEEEAGRKAMKRKISSNYMIRLKGTKVEIREDVSIGKTAIYITKIR